MAASPTVAAFLPMAASPTVAAALPIAASRTVAAAPAVAASPAVAAAPTVGASPMTAIAARIVRAILIAHLKVVNAMTTSLGTSSIISIAVALPIMVIIAAAPTMTAAPMMPIAARIVLAILIAHLKVGNATTTNLGTSSIISIAVALPIMVIIAAAPTMTAAPMMPIVARSVLGILIAHLKAAIATTINPGTSNTIWIAVVACHDGAVVV
jgi:hypothetical protein